MDPIQPAFDPWRDTEAERAPERDDPFDDGSMQGPFGTLSEIMGVPRITAGSRTPRKMAGSGILTNGLIVLIIGVAIASLAAAVTFLL